MNKLFKNIGKKLVEVADSVAYYNVDKQAVAVGTAAGEHGKQAIDPCLDAQLRNVRSKLVRKLFHEHAASEYTEWSDVGILVGSYNVNGKKPPPGLKVSDWLSSLKEGSGGSGGGYADIIVLGFQEVVPLSAGNVIVGSASTNIDAWDRAVAAELNGEQWANAKYGAAMVEASGPSASAPSVTSTAGAAAVAAAAASNNPVADALERKWSGAAPGTASGMAGAEGRTVTERIDALTGGPGSTNCYFQVVSKQMVGLYLSVWVRKSLLPHVRGIQTAVVATGFGGYLGNKGAVAARLYVHDTPLCFVNAHLSSGDKEGDEAKRNADVLDILQRCDFVAAAAYDQSMSSPSAHLLASALGPATWGGLRTITDHANAIWLGDLNYRLHATPDDDARRLIRSNQLTQLLEADQLRREMAAGRVFKGWREGAITFPPTFKFKVGTNMYLGDTPSTAVLGGGGTGAEDDLDDEYEDVGAGAGGAEAEKQKKRTPAWCDRVLFTPGGALSQGAYVRGETTASDHKPVASRLALRTARYDRKKIDALLHACRQQADMQQAAQRPRPSLEPNLVSIGAIKYGQVRSFRVTLSNSGPIEGLYHFVPPPSAAFGDDETPGLPAWVMAVPEEGYVPAGGSCEIELRVCVEGGARGAASALARSADDCLDAIVILRVEDGSDLFLSLTGTYERSKWLGLPLESIASNPGPAAGLPCMLQHLLSFLEGAHALSTQGLFVQSVGIVLGGAVPGAMPGPGQGSGDSSLLSGPSREMQRALMQRLAPLIDALENGQELPQAASAHEAAALLLLFLGELPRPLLPAATVMLLDAALQAGQVPDPASIPDVFLSDLLSPVELQLVSRLLTLVRKVAASPATCVSTQDLANLLSLYLLPPLGPQAPAGARERQHKVMCVMLE